MCRPKAFSLTTILFLFSYYLSIGKGDTQENDEELTEDHDLVHERNDDQFSNDQYDSDEINQYQNEEKNEECGIQDEDYHR